MVAVQLQINMGELNYVIILRNLIVACLSKTHQF